MTDRKKTILHLIIGTAGAYACLLAVNLLNQIIVASCSIGWRMVLMIAAYWLIAVIPLILMISAKNKPADYGFSKEKIGLQIVLGIIIGLCMSFVLTLIPIFAGKGDWVDNGHNYTKLWQFIYDFVYFITAVGFTEEFVFRGFIFSKAKKLGGSTTAVIVSSVLFGLFHFLSGNVIQLFTTGFIGVILCLCREKIKGCTLLSVILAHGIYDALITVWAYVF